MEIKEPVTATLQPSPAHEGVPKFRLIRPFEQLINTPAKADTGDEYYWQHQDQLQRSDIQFQSSTFDLKRKEAPAETFCSKTDPKPAQQASKQNERIPEEAIDSHKRHIMSYRLPINPFVSKPLHASSQTTIACAAVHSMPTKNQERAMDKIKANSTSYPAYPKVFKTHHLFIEQHQAELTLKTQTLDPSEQKELKQLIKTYLKNKGISLKHLTINGVKND